MMNPPDHETYRVLAHRSLIQLRDWRGGAPPVVFLHSITANSLLALRLGALLSPRWRVIAPDLRGRGGSDAPFGEYSPQGHVKDMLAVLDTLGIETFILAGHSFGAMLSVLIAAHHPERVAKVILFDGGASPDPTAAQALTLYYDSIPYRYPDSDAYVNRFKGSPLYQPWTDELEALIRSNLTLQPDGTYIRSIARYVLEAERKPENLVQLAELDALHAKIACPVLIVRAGMGMFSVDDPLLSEDILAKMVKAFPNARAVTIPDAGHTSLMTIPSTIRDQALITFLERA
ncbi:MAG TPA: alpha/beta hydrolase [Aggregatilineales bacterium]|nr:alpha/beta hydrolase [Anaerolineales bacterium]HRE47000.1 alpha/beta hydrolase [Aggregatilineales bacterium]